MRILACPDDSSQSLVVWKILDITNTWFVFVIAGLKSKPLLLDECVLFLKQILVSSLDRSIADNNNCIDLTE